MPDVRNILVIQTAFPGDVILTLPMVQQLRKFHPEAGIDLLVTPSSAELLRNHPAIRSALSYDKRNTESGIGGFLQQVKKIRSLGYGLAIIPHRSIRSASLALAGGIPARIGFETSAGRSLLTGRVPYDPSAHEVDRNLSLLTAIGLTRPSREFPELYPSDDDRGRVASVLEEAGIGGGVVVGIAPGTVWNTKQWLPERFAECIRSLRNDGIHVVLVGGSQDRELCRRLAGAEGGSGRVLPAAGLLTFLQSAELIRRCAVLVSNDSAPMHLALAMRTPVVAIFGATVPAFGFAPFGDRDIVLGTDGLRCRPCSIHGSSVCPIGTFECMTGVPASSVLEKVRSILGVAEAGRT